MKNSTKEISPDEKEEINELAQKTILTEFESTVEVLRRRYNYNEIASVLDKTTSNISSTASKVNKKIKEAEKTVQLVDRVPSLIRSANDPLSDGWLGLDWTEWNELSELDSLPASEPGLYRIRHPAVTGLVYIGCSTSVRRRIRALAAATYQDSTPRAAPHHVAPPMYKLRQAYDSDENNSFEVSAATPSFVIRREHLEGVADALIASYRRKYGGSPPFNFSRDFTGLPIKEPPTTRTIKWQQWQDPRDLNWMGLLWSDPVPLAEHDNTEIPKQGIYRIWYPSGTDTKKTKQPLEYIGESDDLIDAIQSRRFDFEDRSVFSTIELQFEDTVRRELQTDFLGVHYLALDKPPRSQYSDPDQTLI